MDISRESGEERAGKRFCTRTYYTLYHPVQVSIHTFQVALV
jgi:hypothetical protein